MGGAGLGGGPVGGNGLGGGLVGGVVGLCGGLEGGSVGGVELGGGFVGGLGGGELSGAVWHDPFESQYTEQQLAWSVHASPSGSH